MPETLAAVTLLKQVQEVLKLDETALPQPMSFDVPNGETLSNLDGAIFICVDCEAFEYDQSKLTEIGVAVLDTADLRDVDTGESAANWIKKMKYSHFRVLDHKSYCNRRFVKGREDHFNFGSSTWIHLADAKQVMDRVFADPTRLSHAASFHIDIEQQNRPIILVGHGLKNDETFLRYIGFAPSEVSNIACHMDTEVAAGSVKKRSVSLKRLLLGLGIDARNLHNGGNDAAYTLQALILLALRAQNDSEAMFAAIDATPRRAIPANNDGEMASTVYGGTTQRPDQTWTAQPDGNPAALSYSIREYRCRKGAAADQQTDLLKPSSRSTDVTNSDS